jgi:hypothetical protein
MRAQLTPRAQRDVEELWALRREAVQLLDVIAAEFKTDPTSVQCFDARTVQRAIEVSARIKKIDVFGGSF